MIMSRGVNDLLPKFSQYSERAACTNALSLLKDGQVCLLPIFANFRKISLTSLIMRHLAGIIGRLRKGQSLVVAAEVGS